MNNFELMSKKLSEGFKLSDMSCDICSNVILFNCDKNVGFCCSCKEEKITDLGLKNNVNNQDKNNLNKKDNKSDNFSNNSNTISTYLLKGWRLLDKYCEKCINPLMDKNKKLMCVVCGIQYITNQEELAKNKNKKLPEIKEEENNINLEKEVNKTDVKIDNNKLKSKWEELKLKIYEKLYFRLTQNNYENVDTLLKMSEHFSEDLKLFK